MPLIDMPLEKLLQYEGRNPRPADFDQYWDDALAEMRSVDADISLEPAPFNVPGAECFDLWFTGVRGARVHAKYLRPKGSEKPHPAACMFHGYTGSSGDWFDKLSYVAMGFSIAALDCRGQGGKSEDTGGVKGNTHRGHIIRGLDDENPHNLLFRHIYLDTAQLAGIVMGFDEVDAERVCAIGGSQGGGLTLACAALEPRIRKAVPVFPFLCDYLRVWEMDLAQGAYEELRTYLRMFDPTHARKDQIFTRLGYIDVQFLAPRIKADVLMGVGLMDTICPPSTQYAAFNKITSPKQTIIYPDFGHEGLPGFHDRAFEFMSSW
ncbi:MAG: acetylxylan esterase [Armatimonadetes bacterium]|jgi:cephalosporin-C deacetylase|nr:acetylxylan esterase [Armatimonadota bacterium]MDI9586590.1 acetylxylan esterase [Acidobacteriota bacterium]